MKGNDGKKSTEAEKKKERKEEILISVCGSSFIPLFICLVMEYLTLKSK